MENAKLNILFLSSWYPDKKRPLSGIFVKRQAVAMAKYCNVSAIFISSGEKPGLIESIEDGVYTIRGYYKNVTSRIPLLSQYVKLLRYFAAWRKALTLLKMNRGIPDLIHSNIVYPVSIIAKNLSQKWHVPYIISEHWSGYFPEDGRYTGFMLKFISQRAVQGGSAIITVSESLKKSMLHAGLANNYFVISNIVDTDTFDIPATPVNTDKFTFIHVSSLDEIEKNVSGIIRVFSNVHKVYPQSELIIVGEGENKPELENLAHSLQLTNLVRFVGAKPKEEVAKYMQHSDAFILFSNFETQGVALLEALCCGIPGISTNVGGAPEYITPINGILIEPRNQSQLQQAMIDMVKNKNLYNPLSIRNSVIGMVSETNVAAKIMDVYNNLLRK